MKVVKFYSGFTLAEVLITLGIIGIIAAITIPSLINNTDEVATITALKKSYSTLSNAYKLAENDNGTPDNWGFSVANQRPYLEKMVPYLNVSKDCLDGSKGCFPKGVMYKLLYPDGDDSMNAQVYDDSTSPKLALADGTSIIGFMSSSSCTDPRGSTPVLSNVCGYLVVDINGYKNPNQHGKDTFYFYLTKYGVFPTGSAQDSYNFTDYCEGDYGGSACAAWILSNQNMDYTKCRDLDWDTKTKCN